MGSVHEQQGAPVEKYVPDAEWVLPASGYVDYGPPLTTSLFDDPARLERALDLTHATLSAEAQEDEATRQRVRTMAENLIDKANAKAESLGAGDIAPEVQAGSKNDERNPLPTFLGRLPFRR